MPIQLLMRINIYLLIALLMVLALVAVRHSGFTTYHRLNMKKQPNLHCSLMATCPQYLKAGAGFTKHLQAELQQVNQTNPNHILLHKQQQLTQVHRLMPVIDTLLDVTNHLSPQLIQDSTQYVLQVEILANPPYEIEIYYTRQDSLYVIDSIDGLAELFAHYPTQ